MTTLTAAQRREILKSAGAATRAEFADAVATRTKLTRSDVLKLASTPEERAALAEVLDAVTKATGSNAVKARSIRDISGGVEALVKLAGLLV